MLSLIGKVKEFWKVWNIYYELHSNKNTKRAAWMDFFCILVSQFENRSQKEDFCKYHNFTPFLLNIFIYIFLKYIKTFSQLKHHFHNFYIYKILFLKVSYIIYNLSWQHNCLAQAIDICIESYNGNRTVASVFKFFIIVIYLNKTSNKLQLAPIARPTLQDHKLVQLCSHTSHH